MSNDYRYKPRPICSRRALLFALALIAAPWVGAGLLVLAMASK